MIVFPLFADQYDNAQRVHEKGFGIRLEPYEFEEAQLICAIDRLIKDDQLKRRLEVAKQRIARDNTKQKACLKMEVLVKQWKQTQ